MPANLHACGNAVAGQVFETFASLRACLEHAGYATLMKHQPALAQVWMDRHQDEASLKAMKQAFTQGNVQDALTALDQKAATVYERLYQDCIDFGGHPNILGVAGSMKVEKVGDTRVPAAVSLTHPGQGFSWRCFITAIDPRARTVGKSGGMLQLLRCRFPTACEVRRDCRRLLFGGRSAAVSE